MPSTTRTAPSPYRLVFMLALGLVVIAQIIAMVMLLNGQVKAARERDALEASSRVAAARCFESSAARGMDMCRATGATRSAGGGLDSYDASNASPAGVVAVSYGYSASK